MLTPPRDADEAFVRLVPDLQEISDFIDTSPLGARERVRLAHMLAEHFVLLARLGARRGLRLVPPASGRSE